MESFSFVILVISALYAWFEYFTKENKEQVSDGLLAPAILSFLIFYWDQFLDFINTLG